VLVPESIDDLRQLVRRTAAVSRPIEGRLSGEVLRSCLGRISVLGRGEAWPAFNGRPMAPLAQLNLTESPYVPPELAQFSLIAVWLAEEDDHFETPDEHPNGSRWAVRAYQSLDDVVGVEGYRLAWVRPREVHWQVIEDYPDWEDVANLVDYERLNDLLAGRDYYDVLGHAADGTKLGGWPNLIQSEIFWGPGGRHPASPRYAFQVDSEERVGLNLWDAGVLYVGLGAQHGQPVWVAASQFM
jgi:hypothetical protein